MSNRTNSHRWTIKLTTHREETGQWFAEWSDTRIGNINTGSGIGSYGDTEAEAVGRAFNTLSHVVFELDEVDQEMKDTP